MGDCAGLERVRPVKVPDGVVPLLELVCVARVVAELENEGSLAALEDVVIWTELISVVDGTSDDVCEELGCGLKVVISAGLFRTVVDDMVGKLADNILVEKIEKID